MVDELPDFVKNKIKNYTIIDEKLLKTSFNYLCVECEEKIKDIDLFSCKKPTIFICPHCLHKNITAYSFLPKLCEFCAKKLKRCQNCVTEI